VSGSAAGSGGRGAAVGIMMSVDIFDSYIASYIAAGTNNEGIKPRLR
jgi:hypothetical protein